MQKIYLDETNHATLICPLCGKTKLIDAAPLLKGKGSVKITARFKCDACDCGHKSCEECRKNNCTSGNTIIFQLERRKHFRKEVSLAGSLISANGKKYPLHIIDLSRSGVKIHLPAAIPLAIGQKIIIEFTLDDVRHSLITKELTIRRIADKVVSGEFDDIDNYDNNDKKIGFYLMNLQAKTEA